MRLVIQGSDIATQDLKTLARLSGAAGIRQCSATAFELQGAGPAAGIHAFCAEHALDHGLVPDDLYLEDFRLLVLDMDATLINIECLDELADLRGIADQIRPVTEAAMRGEVEFEASFRARLKLLAGTTETQMARLLSERIRFNPGAEALLATCRAAGLQTALVTGAAGYFAEAVARRAGMDHLVCNHWDMQDGQFTGTITGELIDGGAKARHVARIAAAIGASADEVICVGDGANDVPMLVSAGVGIAWHGKPKARHAAHYCLDHVGLDGILHLLPRRPVVDPTPDDLSDL